MMKSRIFATSLLALCCSSVAIAGDPKAAPDVVGRDMNSFFFWYLGHVGVWSGSSVIEVLNESVVIQSNTLSNFKQRVKNGYWGARYGIGVANGTKITSALWAQRNFSPAYTFTTVWREGGINQTRCTQYNSKGQCIKSVTSQTTGAFRCDTFVNFGFIKGNGKDLVAGGAITPTITYKSMPYVRA
jgi:hypothetical protein